MRWLCELFRLGMLNELPLSSVVGFSLDAEVWFYSGLYRFVLVGNVLLFNLAPSS